MTRLPQSAQRVLALALLGAIPGAVWLLAGAPLLDRYQDAAAKVERLSLGLDHAERVAAQLDALRSRLTELRNRTAEQEGFLKGETESVVGAQLQARLKQLVESTHGELKTTQIMAPRDDGTFRRVTVRCQISLDGASLQQVIYELEAHPPFLFIDNLRIDARAAPQGVGEEKLEVLLDIYGFIRGPRDGAL